MLQATRPPLASPALRASQTLLRQTISQPAHNPPSLRIVHDALIPSADWGPLSRTPIATRDAGSYFTTVTLPTLCKLTASDAFCPSPPAKRSNNANPSYVTVPLAEGAGSPTTPTAQRPYHGGRMHSSSFPNCTLGYTTPSSMMSPLLTPTPARVRAASVNAAINSENRDGKSGRTVVTGSRPRSTTLTAVLESSRERFTPVVEHEKWALIKEGVCTKIVSTQSDARPSKLLAHGNGALPPIVSKLPCAHIDASSAVEACPLQPVRPRLTHDLNTISSVRKERVKGLVTIPLPLQDKCTLGKLRKGTPGVVLGRQQEDYFV